MKTMTDLRTLLDTYHLTQAAFARRFGIPLRTVESWCRGLRTPPPYVLRLLTEALERDAK